MATGDHDWVAAEVVTAANLDDFVQLQVLGQYTNGAGRDSALSTRKREGMHTYQLDTNCDTVYSGSAWSTIGPVHGALTTWTPTVTQSGLVAITVNYARYQRIGRLIIAFMSVSVTGSGTGANAVIIGGLPFTSGSSTLVIGQGELRDASATNTFPFHFFLESTTTLSLHDASSVANDLKLGITGFTAGLASTDFVIGTFMYEAAADA